MLLLAGRPWPSGSCLRALAMCPPFRGDPLEPGAVQEGFHLASHPSHYDHTRIDFSRVPSFGENRLSDRWGLSHPRISTRTWKVMAARRPAAEPLPPPPKNGKIKVALCQISSGEDKNKNIVHAKEMIEKAADQGADLVMLPEIWNSPYSTDSFPVYAEEIDDDFERSPSAKMMAQVALERRITLVGGSIPELKEGKLYNTCCVFGSDGKLKGKYSKLHLFDIDIPGKITFKESLTLTKGEKTLVIDTDCGRIGIGICYDIRFPELSMIYAARGVQILCYPGAFNLTTGPLHWELLQRARAVDNQLFVLTCAPARVKGSSYQAWGHSTAVAPFGEILATTDHEEAIVFAELDFSLIEQRRESMQLSSQRRGDIYELVDLERV